MKPNFRNDVKATTSITDWVISVVVLAILGVGVALPIVVDSVSSVAANLSGTAAMVVNVIPTIVAVVVLLLFLGRR